MHFNCSADDNVSHNSALPEGHEISLFTGIQMLPPSPEVKIFWDTDRFMDLLRSHWHPKFERERENDELTACVNIRRGTSTRNFGD